MCCIQLKKIWIPDCWFQPNENKCSLIPIIGPVFKKLNPLVVYCKNTFIQAINPMGLEMFLFELTWKYIEEPSLLLCVLYAVIHYHNWVPLWFVFSLVSIYFYCKSCIIVSPIFKGMELCSGKKCLVFICILYRE